MAESAPIRTDFPDSIVDFADTSEFSADQLAVWNLQKGMYAGFMTGERSRTDKHLAHDVTIWDVLVEKIADGLVEYNALRAARPDPATAPKIEVIECFQPIIDVWDNTAVGRHILRARYVDDASPEEITKVSTAWRRREGEWMLVHSHEDLFLPVP